MTINIIIEIVLAFILLLVAPPFWDCIKSKQFFRTALSSYEVLKKYYNFIGKEKIKEESKVVDPKVGFPANILFIMQVSDSSLDKTRNLLLMGVLVILIASYFFGFTFLIINVAIFFGMSLKKISAAAINNIYSDVHSLILNVYKWNQVDNIECKHFCTIETPRVLENIYRLITEE